MTAIAWRTLWGLAVALALLTVEVNPATAGVSARLSFEEAYDNVNGGDWYRDDHNESALLAWGESYVMMSLAAMYRGTGDPRYLDRLAWHIDGVLANRDDARGVSDYRGVSGTCWQNRHYQPADEPYCYVVHTGMLTWPMAQYALYVQQDGLAQEMAPDGESYGSKAARYLTAVEQSVAFHDDQWNAAGYYVFRSDATFLAHAGADLPLNQSNALGRTLLTLYDLTGTQAYLDKATALATRFRAQCTTAADGALLWNYWGGAYSGDGEDISHAALNVGFARQAQLAGVGFSAADLDAMATTFVRRIYVDDATIADHIGGGAVNGSSYRPQVGRWVVLTPLRTTVYAAVRDLYERDYPPAGIGSGSLLYGWALLAEHEPPRCAHFFYSVDWDDQGPHREATAYGANVLTTPPDLTAPCLIPIEVDVPRQTVAAQWDGAGYHRVAEWQPTGGLALRHVGFEPRWPYVYWHNGVLFEFEDTFVAGDGIRVMEPAPGVAPTITSNPPVTVELGGNPLLYVASGTGDTPRWWSLAQYPTGARVEHDTGTLTWTPTQAGPADFTLRLENDWGTDEQTFTVTVTAPPGPDAGPAGDAGPGADSGTDASIDPDSSADTDGAVVPGDGGDAGNTAPDAGDTSGETNGGCACKATASRHSALGGAWLLTAGLWLLLLGARRSRGGPRP